MKESYKVKLKGLELILDSSNEMSRNARRLHKKKQAKAIGAVLDTERNIRDAQVAQFAGMSQEDLLKRIANRADNDEGYARLYEALTSQPTPKSEFTQALSKLSPEELEAFIQQRCIDDPEFADEFEKATTREEAA